MRLKIKPTVFLVICLWISSTASVGNAVDIPVLPPAPVVEMDESGEGDAPRKRRRRRRRPRKPQQ